MSDPNASERVIDPAEIIVECPNETKENITHANPWMRCIARFFDYALFFLILWAFRKYGHGQNPFGKYEHFIPFEFFVWIPIEALLLSTWGSTPGKFFLKTKIKCVGRNPKLDFLQALHRSFSVWFRGFGMGIPVVNFFCLLIAYHRLKVFQITSWDRDAKIQVTHYPIRSWRVVFACFFAIIVFLSYYWNAR
jgi:hypothetical protein